MMPPEFFLEQLKKLHINYILYTEWHYLIAARFDYYPTKDKWYDRGGVYGTIYGVHKLLIILVNGPKVLEPGEVGKFRKVPEVPEIPDHIYEEEEQVRTNKDIVGDIIDLLIELKDRMED